VDERRQSRPLVGEFANGKLGSYGAKRTDALTLNQRRFICNLKTYPIFCASQICKRAVLSGHGKACDIYNIIRAFRLVGY
jgi:hypothetical protein